MVAIPLPGGFLDVDPSVLMMNRGFLKGKSKINSCLNCSAIKFCANFDHLTRMDFKVSSKVLTGLTDSLGDANNAYTDSIISCRW